MRYYPIKKIDTSGIHRKLNDYTCVEKDDKILLTQYGMFKYINDALVVCKFNQEENNDTVIKKCINGVDFIITPNKWGKTDKRYHLPFVNEIIQIKTLKFSPRKDSKFNFIIEKIKNITLDYYIESPENYDSHSLKEDIGSFLDKLK